MSHSDNSITLFTQPGCTFCDIMKDLLNQTGFTYYTVNIQENDKAKEFLRTNGHRTVPQLYVGNKHVNKLNTVEYTADKLYNLIKESLEQWPWADSGIEQGI